MRKAILMALIALSVGAGAAQTYHFPTLELDHPAAPFVMTYAYAQSVGATSEFNKMEGVIADDEGMKLYIAMSDVRNAMTDGEGDLDLEENPCGIVYVAELDETYDITRLDPLVEGGAYDPDAENRCAVDGIANPDNVAVDAMGRLWIGEDSSNHRNNALWVFDPETEELKRFATTPLGAEVTGLHISENGTLFMNVQHPDPTNVHPFNRGVVGVVAGFDANTDDFVELSVPQGDDQKIARVAAGTYQILGRMGDAIVGDPTGSAFGEIKTLDDGAHMGFCNDPDGNMFLPVNEAGSEGYLYTNWECRPGGISKLYIARDAAGAWHAVEGERVDMSAVNGTITNCFASVTPWNTGLSGEEYPPEVAEVWNNGLDAVMAEYLGGLPNPYDYGYPIELAPAEVGSEVVKHYAMGRFSVENATVMADGKTAYYGDDGGNRLLFKFVADEAGNLGAGTLYAGKITQDDQSLVIDWIELGHGVDDEVEAAIRELDAVIAANSGD